MHVLELKVPPLVLTLVFGIMMVFGSAFLPALHVSDWVRMPLFLIAFIAGVSFCAAGVLEFRRHKTTVDPRYPEKVSELVNSGIYKVTRNPMYVGFALLLLSIVFYLQSPVLLLGVCGFIVYMNRFQIVPEEETLAAAFGDKYELYRRTVRRWI